MSYILAWISALRPRTLFLAIATALCGSGIAYSTGQFSWSVCVLTILIATILQLLSNLANDLGDFEHGTDITGERVGPERALQSGTITARSMKRGIVISIICAVVVGILLVYEALQFMHWSYIVLFLLLGFLSIIAAIKYTRGDNPYGYRGLGDLFSFIFFGLVSVIGTYFLHTHSFDLQPFFPAVGMGLFTVSVLNINNMRDMDNDRKSGKITIPIRLGFENAKRYHAILLLGGILCFLCYSILYSIHYYQYIYLLISFLFIKILVNIYNCKENRLLDPYLKYTSLATFLLAILFVISINL